MTEKRLGYNDYVSTLPYEQLKKDQITLNSKIEDLEHKNSLLPENIDLDFIEILIREKFLFGKEGETTYIIKDNGNQK